MNIKNRLFISLIVAVSFIVVSISAGLITVGKNENQVLASKTKYLSFVLADEFRHTSMDLTRLARSYVATGEQKYWDQYFAIVNWRAGKIPRPNDVNKDLYPNKVKSQKSIMQELNFSKQEFDLLAKADAASNDLINTETQAMETIKQQQFVDGPFNLMSGESIKAFALRLVFDDNYHSEVIKIMAPVNQFFTALEKRTESNLAQASDSASNWLSIAFYLQVITGILILLVAYFIAQVLFKPLNNAISTMMLVDMGNGRVDLTNRLDEKGNDEMSDLGKSFNFFSGSVEQLISRSNSSMVQLSDSSKVLSEIAAQTQKSFITQEEGLAQVATAAQEMVATVQEVAANASEASTIAGEAEDKANNGFTIVEEAVSNIDSLSNEIAKASHAIESVENDSKTITTVLDVIKSIADQTNLLALNAAIEAARAGEQGRGFAVVADEVRSLAKRTQDSTTEIQNMIENLQRNSGEAVAVMENSTTQAAICVERTNQAGESLSSLLDSINRMTDMNAQIATASEEQSLVIEDISKNIHLVMEELTESSKAVDLTAKNSTELACLSESLSEQLKLFRLN